MRGGRSIGRELGVLLAVKAAALLLLWLLFFPDWRRPVADAAATARHLAPAATPPSVPAPRHPDQGALR